MTAKAKEDITKSEADPCPSNPVRVPSGAAAVVDVFNLTALTGSVTVTVTGQAQ